MIYFRGECQTIRPGINIYPPREWKYSRGFVLRLWNRLFWVRYSVKAERWFIFSRKRPTE